MRKNMIEADEDKLSYEEYEKKPGMLSAKIIYNQLVKNNYRVFAIGHINGNLLFNVAVGKDNYATTLFTTKEIALAFINKSEIKKMLYKNYGKIVVLLDTSLSQLCLFVNPSNMHYLNVAIINPNRSDFFIPINMSYFAKLVMEDKILKNQSEDFNLSTVEYDDSLKEYCFNDENNPFKN